MTTIMTSTSSKGNFQDTMDLLQRCYAYGRSSFTTDPTTLPLHVYIFGETITKSLSPLIQGIFFRHLQARWTFNLATTTNPADFVTKLNEDTFIGGSITMPNKLSFISCLDDITEEVRVIGAVNTSFVRLDPTGKRRHIGANTDCIGIRETILHRNPDAKNTAQGRPALVIGAGGAARSAIYALWKWFGASEIYIVNRLETEAEEMIASFHGRVPDIKLRYIPSVKSIDSLEAPYLTVGTIPDYPPQAPEEVLCLQICEAIFQRKPGVMLDMCYMPSPVTTLLKKAQGYGWTVVSGAEVLVQVCAAQQILWLEREPIPEAVEEALEAIRERVEAKL